MMIGEIFEHRDYKHYGKPMRLRAVRPFKDDGFIAVDDNEVPKVEGEYIRIFCFPLGVEPEDVKTVQEAT